MSTENFTPAGPGAPQPEVKKNAGFCGVGTVHCGFHPHACRSHHHGSTGRGRDWWGH